MDEIARIYELIPRRGYPINVVYDINYDAFQVIWQNPATERKASGTVEPWMFTDPSLEDFLIQMEDRAHQLLDSP